MSQIVSTFLGVLLIVVAGGIIIICTWRSTTGTRADHIAGDEIARLARRLDRQTVFSSLVPFANFIAVIGAFLIVAGLFLRESLDTGRFETRPSSPVTTIPLPDRSEPKYTPPTPSYPPAVPEAPSQ